MIQVSKIEYMHDGTSLEGLYAFDADQSGKRPVILIAHDWSGRNDWMQEVAKKIAKLGYVGFALDMYGRGKIGKTNEEKMALMAPLKNNRKYLQQRMLAALDIAKSLDRVDSNKTGAIGFCFGGLCALDLARSGAEVSGVVSFHGLLDAPPHQEDAVIKAKVLAMHGHDDKMVPPSQVLAFETEMTEANVDWQVHVYGHTMHAFMNPLANDPDFGTVYDARTAQRSWTAMTHFFEEIFA